MNTPALIKYSLILFGITAGMVAADIGAAAYYHLIPGLYIQTPGAPPPPTIDDQGFGDDTPEPGKPLHCDNYKQTPEAQRCRCGRAMQRCHGLPEPPVDVRSDHRCTTYCRQQNCQCAGTGCRS